MSVPWHIVPRRKVSAIGRAAALHRAPALSVERLALELDPVVTDVAGVQHADTRSSVDERSRAVACWLAVVDAVHHAARCRRWTKEVRWYAVFDAGARALRSRRGASAQAGGVSAPRRGWRVRRRARRATRRGH